METAAAKKKKIVSMTSACASVAPESCGIIFRVIHPPRMAPTAKQISPMSDPETERPAAPPIANPRKTTLPVMLAVKTWPSARKLTASTIPVTAVMLRRTEGDAPVLGSFACCASLIAGAAGQRSYARDQNSGSRKFHHKTSKLVSGPKGHVV